MSPAACSLSKQYAPDLNDIEEEIIFSSTDGNEAYDDEDILLAFEPCIHFGTQMFPHYDDSCLCEFVPSSRMMCFSDGEPLLATTKEPYVGKSVVGEPDCFRGPKGPTTGPAGFNLDTSSMNQDPALIALSTSTSDGEQTVLDNLAAGYVHDVYPQVLPGPPSYISLLPSDSINEPMMAFVKDKTQAHGNKCTIPHVPVKADGYAQGIHLMKISHAPSSSPCHLLSMGC